MRIRNTTWPKLRMGWLLTFAGLRSCCSDGERKQQRNDWVESARCCRPLTEILVNYVRTYVACLGGCCGDGAPRKGDRSANDRDAHHRRSTSSGWECFQLGADGKRREVCHVEGANNVSGGRPRCLLHQRVICRAGGALQHVKARTSAMCRHCLD